ncbi:MAG TPA: hypothetical protein VK788_25470 [Terriglobales bacterium]|jgi:hypothetical protein|nr:hypothetical protein [Terriglobales bacterium]
MSTTPNPDRLYQLLPAVYQLRDANQGYPLRALLQVISEQVNIVDADIAQLYENWFVETCQDWVVPYIGDLVGYTPLYDVGQPTGVQSPRAQVRERILIPRSEVANTVRFRRRKGTLAVLEELAAAVAGWPARAVEFYRLLSFTQNINYLRLKRGRTVDIRDGAALDDLGTAFEKIAHIVDVRCIGTRHFPEFYNIPSVGVFVWRLKTYSVTQAPAYCEEQESPNCFLFNVLGSDTPLYTRPQNTSAHPPGKLNLPLPITRRGLDCFETDRATDTMTSGIPYYYGDGKSFEIWTGSPRTLVAASSIVVADLTDWTYRPLPGQIAVDPMLGRIAFPPTQTRRQGVWVSYNYAFSADMGGGEYERILSQPATYNLYLVGQQENFTRINDALKQWQSDNPANAVIEIADSGVYVEPISITLQPAQTLQLRSASGKRPVIRLLNWQTSAPDNLMINGVANADSPSAEPTNWFTLDGVVVTGRGVQVQGSVGGVTIRHSTLVPGWGMDCNCEPVRPTEPSLELDEAPNCVRIEHSIIGAIQVNRDEVREDPCLIYISDSILDATSPKSIALGAPEKLCAFSILDIRRCTVFGQVQTHAITLAENCIFMGVIQDCRRQQGCMRFCYVTSGSRTPKRFECQPDLVEKAIIAQAQQDNPSLSNAIRNVLLQQARARVEPEFNSTRYGKPTYCQLSDHCAPEITTGADDESEMGAFHDLYQPQREANLRARLDEYTPADMNAGTIYAS